MSLLFLEGRGHGLQGGVVPIDQLNINDWSDFFSDTNSEWFLDILSKEDVSSDVIKEPLLNELYIRGKKEIIEY